MAWEGSHVFQPWLVRDGSQYVCYYAGALPTTKIGRAIASNPSGTWTKYANNPVLSVGSSGATDEAAIDGPVVYYDASLSPAWKMWYAGSSSGGTWKTHFADSSDGLSWTKRGVVIGTGAVSSVNETGSVPGCVLLAGSTWYVFLSGIDANGKYHGAWATCTDPADSGTYSAITVLSNFSGDVTVGGKTWRKNQPRGIWQDGSVYRCYVTVFDPSNTSSILEGAVAVTSPDLTSWAAPSALMLPFDSWAAVSSENPVIVPSY